MEFLNALITGPVLPATVMAGLMLCWSILAIFGTLDLDLASDIDVDMDMDVDISDMSVTSNGLGYVALRWLNIGQVPLMIWGCVLAVNWWVVSVSTWIFGYSNFFQDSPGWLWSTLLAGINLGIAIVITKYLTAPMKHWFVVEKITARNLVGQECEISSLEATPEFGQVKYKTDGAPLLLNVRTDGEHLMKGTRVWITHYDAKQRVYIVTPTGTGED